LVLADNSTFCTYWYTIEPHRTTDGGAFVRPGPASGDQQFGNLLPGSLKNGSSTAPTTKIKHRISPQAVTKMTMNMPETSQD
jgi:hypothetical protein